MKTIEIDYSTYKVEGGDFKLIEVESPFYYCR